MCNYNRLKAEVDRLREEHDLYDVKPLVEVSNHGDLQSLQNAMASALSAAGNPSATSYSLDDIESIDHLYQLAYPE